MSPAWLDVRRGERPLIVAFPHAGTGIPESIARNFLSVNLARRDADWWVDQLYAFVRDLGATTIRTSISRSVIDVNRDPSGASLYPGQPTTDLCPVMTFDGEPLYKQGHEPSQEEIERRRSAWFEPYHESIGQEINRLKTQHGRVVLYDAHSIRSTVPRLFDGLLPVFNIGTNHDRTCASSLADAVERICKGSGEPTVRNGRFKGGWTTRHYGQPDADIHAIQMELACRCYLDEPVGAVSDETWPVPFNPSRASPVTRILTDVLGACLDFAEQ